MAKKRCTAETLAEIADSVSDDEINNLHDRLMQSLNAEQKALFRAYDDATIARANDIQDRTAKFFLN